MFVGVSRRDDRSRKLAGHLAGSQETMCVVEGSPVWKREVSLKALDEDS